MASRYSRRSGLVLALSLLTGFAGFGALLAQSAPPEPPGVAAHEVELAFPLGIALGPDGSVYVSERQGHRVQRLDPATGRVTVVAGTGEEGFSGDGGPAVKAQLGCPDSLDADAEGNLYIADRCNHRIRRIDAATGIITTVAGNGERGVAPDGPALGQPLMGPFFVRAESPTVLLYTDTDSHRIRRIDLEEGTIETLAGSGEGGFSGDGGPALKAAFARPHVAIYAKNGDLIIGDSFNQKIRVVDGKTGVVQTIAGKGERGAAEDGAVALEAPFGYFGGIQEEADGDLLLTEWTNGRLLRLERKTGRLRVLAGTTDESASPADGQALRRTYLGRTADFVLDRQGRIIVANTSAGSVRRIDLQKGTITTLIGPDAASNRKDQGKDQ